MITALASTNPNPSMGNEARTFDRFVGTWDCDFSFHLDDGSVRYQRGELLFGWILDRRAVQDIWITYPADGQKDRTIGTSLRFFDTALKQDRPRGHGFRRPPDPLVFQRDEARLLRLARREIP